MKIKKACKQGIIQVMLAHSITEQLYENLTKNVCLLCLHTVSAKKSSLPFVYYKRNTLQHKTLQRKNFSASKLLVFIVYNHSSQVAGG